MQKQQVLTSNAEVAGATQMQKEQALNRNAEVAGDTQ
jgi:hypothetical protein